MTEFYVVCYRMVDGIQIDNLLFSAGVIWSGKKFGGINTLPKHDNLFIDSGGFNVIKRWGVFPFSVDEYLDFVRQYNPSMFAVMDYPCEPELGSRPKHLKTNRERIEETIKNTSEIIDKWDDESKPIPVIQGYTRSEYLYCIDRLRDQGLITDYMAVGSLCVRKRITEIRGVLRMIKKELPKTRLHAFGIKLSAMDDPLMWELVYSCDSNAWIMPIHSGKLYVYTGKRITEVRPEARLNGVEQRTICLRAYLECWAKLKLKYSDPNQRKIEDFNCPQKEGVHKPLENAGIVGGV